MAEELSYEESDYDSDHVDSLGSSNESELSLSFEFSPFEGGSPGSEAAEGEAVEGLSYTNQTAAFITNLPDIQISSFILNVLQSHLSS